jgi:cell division protein FtsL
MIWIIIKNTFSTKHSLLVTVLALAVFASALSVVYVRFTHQRLFIQFEQEHIIQSRLNVTWTQLLLEQSAYSAQSRVESLATTKLNMVEPRAKDMRILAVTK